MIFFLGRIRQGEFRNSYEEIYLTLKSPKVFTKGSNSKNLTFLELVSKQNLHTFFRAADCVPKGFAASASKD